MPRPTMFDQYGRCIHCGFWHPDLDAPMARLCGEHEAKYLGTGRTPWGACGCVFKTLPAPEKGKDGLWYVQGVLKPDEIASPTPLLTPVCTEEFTTKPFSFRVKAADWCRKLFGTAGR